MKKKGILKKDRMQTMNVVSVNIGAEPTGYTREGIERMAKAIRASIKVREWTERKLRLEIQQRAKDLGQPELHLSGSTLNRYAGSPPTIKQPKAEALKAIAPFVFRVIAINGDDIQLDLDHTYEDDWREFARIGTADFEKSATLRTQMPPSRYHNQTPGWEQAMDLDAIGRGSGAVGRLIRAEMSERNLDPTTEEGFREFLSHFPANDEADVAELRDVVQGQIAFVDDRIIGYVAKALRMFTGNKRYTVEVLANLNTPNGTTNGHTHSTPGLGS